MTERRWKVLFAVLIALNLLAWQMDGFPGPSALAHDLAATSLTEDTIQTAYEEQWVAEEVATVSYNGVSVCLVPREQLPAPNTGNYLPAQTTITKWKVTGHVHRIRRRP